MDYQDINEIVNDHFSSFDRLTVENRKISIVQSTRLILSIIRCRIIKEVIDDEKDHIRGLFKTLDTSLNYIISKDAIDDMLYNKSATGLDMKSDIQDDEENENEEDESVDSRMNVNEVVNNDKNNDNNSDNSDSDEESTSLNSIYSVSLNSPSKNKIRRNKTDKDDKGKEPESDSNNNEDDNEDEEDKEENELFSMTPYPYSLDKLQRIEDPKFHDLLKSLRDHQIYTHSPYKLYRMLRHHSSFFKDNKDILTCSTYSLPINAGHIRLLSDYFGFE